MAARKPEAYERARALRERGWPLRHIANEVGVALSTVSLWVRDIQVALPLPRRVLEAASCDDVEIGLERRRCGKCRRELPLTSFNRHRSGYQWWCRDCFQTYFRARGDLHRAQTRAARRRRRLEARAFVNSSLQDRSCSDCGEDDPLVLEFDHLGEKRADVATLIRAGASLRRVRSELAGCDVVCVNCHRVRTAERGGSWRLLPVCLDNQPSLTRGERRNMTYLRELLTHSHCVDCGDQRLIVLEFDHIGAKQGTVTELGRRGCSLERLKAEISQCEIRCGNCHRRRTLQRLGARAKSKEECPRQDSNLQPSP